MPLELLVQGESCRGVMETPQSQSQRRAVKRVSLGRRAARSSPAPHCTPQLIPLSQQKGVKLKLNLNLNLIYVALVCTSKFTRAKHKSFKPVKHTCAGLKLLFGKLGLSWSVQPGLHFLLHDTYMRNSQLQSEDSVRNSSPSHLVLWKGKIQQKHTWQLTWDITAFCFGAQGLVQPTRLMDKKATSTHTRTLRKHLIWNFRDLQK